MPITPFLFSGLILISAILYFYSSWKMVQDRTYEAEDPASPRQVAKRTQYLLFLTALRLLMPFMALVGILWGILWIWLTSGPWSLPMLIFILSVVLGYLILKLFLYSIVFELIQRLKS